MKQNTILRKVKEWAAQSTSLEARNKLIVAGISPRAAEQLIVGDYRHRLRQSTIDRLSSALEEKLL